MALSELLDEHPDIVGLTWSIDTLGTIHGEQYAQDGNGRIVDVCAQILDGTAVHSTLNRDGDRLGLAQLNTVWREVPVEIWGSYPETAAGGVR
ncbi:hypothetical protein ACFYSJ_04795 [Streptomyces sp. NPDC005248]|uniref:hypothetical protein n=1 Tax=Streptomyces sp. NPDC005248 TaxID=3364709 RepID=UPI0036C7FDDE